MPYAARKSETGDGWEVINTETGDIKAHHATETDAAAQVRLLNAIEHGYNAEAPKAAS